MTCLQRTAAALAATLVLLVTSTLRTAAAQGPAAPSPQPAASAPQPGGQPFGPDWASLRGWSVFSRAGCGGCHALRGVGGGVGPDLAEVASARSFYDLGAAIWNHLPRMQEKMAQAHIERARLSAEDAANLMAFLFTAQYYDDLGDPKAGEALFTSKGCALCHSLGGQGGQVGPPLDRLKLANSPVLVAAAMWNHGPAMADRMKAAGLERPSFQGREMQDLIAYIVAGARPVEAKTEQVLPGTPATGAKLFGEKGCRTCHRVAGQGGAVGPALDRPELHVSLTGFAGRMWNHGPRMWAAARSRGIDVPQLSGQDMADILAYLYTSRYGERPGDARRGRQVFQTRGCQSCHAVAGRGGKVGPDLARSAATRTGPALVAGLWNHARSMRVQAEQRKVPWPVLSGEDLADLAAYLRSSARRR